MPHKSAIPFAILSLTALMTLYYLRLSLIRCPIERADRLLRRTESEQRRSSELISRALALPHSRLEILSPDGLRLRALCFPAERLTGDCVVCIHGYRSYGLRDHAETLVEYHRRGYNVLIPDDRAHGDSEGRYIGLGWLDRGDILDWCRLLTERFDNCRILLHGISMGAAGAICAAGEYASGLEGVIRGVIADSSFTSGYEEFKHVSGHYLHLPPFPLLGTTALLAKLVCGLNLRKCSPIDAISRIRVPILLIHGGSDDFVPTEMSRRLSLAGASDCELLIIDGASHGAASTVDHDRYWQTVDRFISRLGMESRSAIA